MKKKARIFFFPHFPGFACIIKMKNEKTGTDDGSPFSDGFHLRKVTSSITGYGHLAAHI